MLTRRAVLRTALAALLLAGAVSDAAAVQPVLIGGGPAGSVYTQAARQICALVNEHAASKYSCVARPVPGPAFTIRAVEIDLMEFALAQSGRAHEAVNGLGAWEGEPVAGLRSVFGMNTVTATLVTSADAAGGLVYDVVRAVFENLDALRSAHPAFRGLDPATMLEGLSAPLHPGAVRYYRERGWL